MTCYTLHGFSIEKVSGIAGWFLSRRRSATLRAGHHVALVWTAALSYLALITLLTWQALRAQSIIAPDALTLQVLAMIISVTALAVLAIGMHARMKSEVYGDTKDLQVREGR